MAKPEHKISPRVVFFLMVAGALVFHFVPAVSRAQDPNQPQLAVNLDLPTYRAELHRCATAVHHSDQIPGLRKSLPRTWVVQAGESRIEVSTQWLSADLRRLEQNPEKGKPAAREIELRLSAMQSAANELENGGTSADAAQTRAHLDEILNRREFAGASGPSQFQILIARMERWIIERLVWLFTRLHLGAKAGNVLAWTVVVIAFLVLAYWIGRYLAHSLRATNMPVAGPAPSDDSRQWVAEALAAAERGDYREAVHCGYWAAIVKLEGLGMLKRDRARTPRESLGLLEPYPKEQKLLGDFTRHFELIWYGYRPASAEDWSGARTHLEKMGCLAPSTAATANS